MSRLKECMKTKTPEWTMSDVTYVLKHLKIGKSKDAYDFPNEIFRPDIAGDDLICAITKIMNRIKNDMLQLCNVTNLYKEKVTEHIIIHIEESSGPKYLATSLINSCTMTSMKM